MKDFGLVSIITPNYNSEKYIRETIESVQAQTYTNWEMLVIDDCSTDGSLKILKELSEKDSRVKILLNKRNSGAAVSRNYGLREAKGKWIAFLDSDDLWVPEKLAKQIHFMNANNYSFSYTNYEEIDEQGHKNGVLVTGPKKIINKGILNVFTFINKMTLVILPLPSRCYFNGFS